MKHLVVILLILVGCEKPTDFELSNKNDPESPDFVLKPATNFWVTPERDGSHTFRWDGGTSTFSVVQIIRISGSDTLWIHNTVPTEDEVTFIPEDIPTKGFRYALRMVFEEHQSSWLQSKGLIYRRSKATPSSINGADTGIEINWTVTTFGLYLTQFGDSIHITIPTDSVSVLRSIDNQPYERVASFLEQTNFIDPEIPQVGHAIRYKLEAWSQGTSSFSQPTESVRRDYAAYHAVRMTFETNMSLLTIDEDENRALMVSNVDYTFYIIDLSQMAIVKSIPITTLRPACTICRERPTGAFGINGEVLVGFGDQVLSWNPSTDAVIVLQHLDNPFNAFDMKVDPITGLVAVLSIYSSTSMEFQLDIIDPVNSTRTTSMRFDAPDAPIIALSPFESTLLLWTTKFASFRIVPLLNPTAYTTIVLASHPGPIIRPQGSSQSKMLLPHTISGLNEYRFDGSVQRVLANYGKINHAQLSNSRNELYLSLDSGHIVILDTYEPGYQEKRQVHYFSMGTYENLWDWNQRTLVMPKQSTSLWELEEHVIWYKGPLPQYPS